MEGVDPLWTIIDDALSARNIRLIELRRAGSEESPSVTAFVDCDDRPVDFDLLVESDRAIRAALSDRGDSPDRYRLQVSSPGLDRPLRSDRDFRRAQGRTVRVIWESERGGVESDRDQEANREVVEGELLGHDESTIRVKAPHGVRSIARARIVRVTMVPQLRGAAAGRPRNRKRRP